MTAPRSRSVRTFSCVAGCSHISVCIAGATMSGTVAFSNTFVSKSSAMPCAIFAMTLAVAGATTITSVSRAMRT